MSQAVARTQRERNKNALRTQQMIQDAFVRLVERGGARAASVAAICREAGINRTTFYGHYENMDALRLTIALSWSNDLIRMIDEVLSARDSAEITEAIRNIGHYYERHLDLYDVIAKVNPGENGMSFRGGLLASRHDDFAEVVTADFLLSSLTAIYHTWAVGAYGDMSVDEVSEQVARIVTRMRMCQ